MESWAEELENNLIELWQQNECIASKHALYITACAVATSCCISDTPSQWERPNFDPP